MKLTKIQRDKIKKFAEKIYKKNDDPFHHFDHAYHTSRVAAYIAQKEKADIDVCWAAGLLHDIASKTRGESHGKKSAHLAKHFLISINLDRDFINDVYWAIIYHDSRKRHLIKTFEGEIIFEADKLSTIGSMGIIREYGDLLIKGHTREEAVQGLLKQLKYYNPRFTTKTAKDLKKEFWKLNVLFLKLYNKYHKL